MVGEHSGFNIDFVLFNILTETSYHEVGNFC